MTWVYAVLPRLVSNLWTQVTFPHQPPRNWYWGPHHKAHYQASFRKVLILLFHNYLIKIKYIKALMEDLPSSLTILPNYPTSYHFEVYDFNMSLEDGTLRFKQEHAISVYGSEGTMIPQGKEQNVSSSALLCPPSAFHLPLQLTGLATVTPPDLLLLSSCSSLVTVFWLFTPLALSRRPWVDYNHGLFLKGIVLVGSSVL